MEIKQMLEPLYVDLPKPENMTEEQELYIHRLFLDPPITVDEEGNARHIVYRWGKENE